MALLTTILVALSPLIQPAASAAPREPVVSSVAPGGAAPSAGSTVSAPSAAPPESAGLASWYVPRPSACWDDQGRHALPPGDNYTAHPTLPCGTLVQLTGPQGSITVPVEDHGPEAWTGRALDLSPAAFQAVAGSLATGVIPVEWGVAP